MEAEVAEEGQAVQLFLTLPMDSRIGFQAQAEVVVRLMAQEGQQVLVKVFGGETLHLQQVRQVVQQQEERVVNGHLGIIVVGIVVLKVVLMAEREEI